MTPPSVARFHGRDSWHSQRIGDALAVEIGDGGMDGLVERDDVCESQMGEVMGLKIASDRLDVVEFGGVFRQPLDGEPMRAGAQGGERAFAGMDRTIVLNQHDRLGLSPGLRSKETVELLQTGR
jgi:O-acetylhomoserine (thiol)-lyase